jgi:hypothetical protein
VVAFNEDRETNEAHVYFALHKNYIPDFKKVLSEWASKKRVDLVPHYDTIGLDNNQCRHHEPPKRERIAVKTLSPSHFRKPSSSSSAPSLNQNPPGQTHPNAHMPMVSNPQFFSGNQGPYFHASADQQVPQQAYLGAPAAIRAQYNPPELPGTRSPVLMANQQAMLSSCPVNHPQEMAAVCVYCTGLLEYPSNTTSLPTRPHQRSSAHSHSQSNPSTNTGNESKIKKYWGLRK